jgi:hypothetical protein
MADAQANSHTEPKPVAVTSSSFVPLSSENDTTPEALVVPDRKSGKQKGEVLALLEHSHGGAMHVEGQRQLEADCSKRRMREVRKKNISSQQCTDEQVKQMKQTYRQTHTRDWS